MPATMIVRYSTKTARMAGTLLLGQDGEIITSVATAGAPASAS